MPTRATRGYEATLRTGRVVEVGCWAHARRRFFKALQTEKEHASSAMAVIAKLYDVERRAREQQLDAVATRELRQRESKPLLEAMKPWLVALRPTVLPKSVLGDAIGYALNQWDALMRYLDDGAIAIDNNRVERQMRAVAVGRKNWMFAGSAEGGARAAVVYSLIGTCGLLRIEPWAT